jgi:hypothetical protein
VTVHAMMRGKSHQRITGAWRGREAESPVNCHDLDGTENHLSDLPPKNSTREDWSSLVIDPPRKTHPKRVGDFDLRGSVCARLAGMIAVNVTQVMTSSKGLEIGA